MYESETEEVCFYVCVGAGGGMEERTQEFCVSKQIGRMETWEPLHKFCRRKMHPTIIL